MIALLQNPPPMPEPASPMMWLLILAALGFLPFLCMLGTCFAKIAIVGALVRQALGTQQIPPNSVITGLALVLTLHVMAPVATKAYADMQDPTTGEVDPSRAVPAVVGALREFTARHTLQADRDLIVELQKQQPVYGPPPPPGPFEQVMAFVTVDAPAFALTELTAAFQIGFLLFVPFLVVDLVVGNILLAMGMHMLSPIIVSLPVKLMLFVLVDGWRLIVAGLARSYLD